MSTLLRITETEPTSLVKDFSAFVGYLKEKRATVTGVSEFINGRALYEINGMMSHPAPNATPRTRQTLYPLLHLFYHLALAGKLFRKATAGKNKLALEPTERLSLYEDLNPAERYFSLLETFWVDTDFKKLLADDAGRFWYQHILWLTEVLSTPSTDGSEAEWKQQLLGMLLGRERLILYFAAFGFCEAVPAPAEKGMPRSWVRLRSVAPTPFGLTLLPVLENERDFIHWNLATRRQECGEWNPEAGGPLEDEEGFQTWIAGLRHGPDIKAEIAIEPYRGVAGEPFFKPFVPLLAEGALAQTLPREKPRFVDGVYRFKVALRQSLWRRIEVSASHTLLDLHYAIQNAYRFDGDHLYSFFMDGQAWSDDRLTSPYDDEGPHVDEVRIGDLGLEAGQRILYLFDYGDEWRFQVTLEEIREEGRRPRKPKTVEQKGRAPEQYGG